MDPASALFFALLLTVVGAKTIGAAVTDTVAVAKGKEPPSKQRFEERQRRREAKGQQRQADSGPWRRRWRNAMAEQREKVDARHEGAMRWLRDNRDQLVAKEYRKRERRARRWEQVGAAAGGFAAARGLRGRLTAAVQAARADHAARPDPYAGLDQLGSVDELCQAYDTAQDDLRREAVREELHRRGYGVLAATIGAPPKLRDRITKAALAAQQAGQDTTLADLDAFTGRLGLIEQHELAAQQQAKADAEQATVLPFRPREEDTTAAGDGEQTPTDTENHPTNCDDTTDTGTAIQEVQTMSAPAHSGEITSLTDAITFAVESRGYCRQIGGTFEAAQAQAQATATEITEQGSRIELAQSTFAGQGMDVSAAQMGKVHEALSMLAAKAQEAAEVNAQFQEALAMASSALDEAKTALEAQQGLAEQAQAHNGNLAKDTAFYANA